MQTARAQRSDAASNRERLLEAALLLLADDRNCSMNDIAGAAGVGRVTLYNHFDTREALVEAVLLRQLDETEATFARSDASLTATERLTDCIAASWRSVARIEGLMAAASSVLGIERVHQAHERLTDHIEQIIREGVSSREFQVAQPTRWLAEVYFDLVHGAALRQTRRNLAEGHVVQLITQSMLVLVGATVTTVSSE